jgi:hypothetical protein
MDYQIVGDIAELFFIRSEKKETLKMDVSDFDRLIKENVRLTITKNRKDSLYQVIVYFIQKDLDKHVAFSKWLLGLTTKQSVLFNNQNRLDFTRTNLTVVSGRNEIAQNRRGAQKNNRSSGIRGVTWDKNRNKWEAQFFVKKKKKFVGRFDDIVEAEKAVMKARSEFFEYSMMDK